MRYLLVLFLLLASCGKHLGPGSYADAMTTHVGLQVGLQEANPLLAWTGDAAPIATLGLKYMLIRIGDHHGMDFRPYVEATGMGAACFNLMQIASAGGPAGVAMGLTCFLAYRGLDDA